MRPKSSSPQPFRLGRCRAATEGVHHPAVAVASFVQNRMSMSFSSPVSDAHELLLEVGAGR